MIPLKKCLLAVTVFSYTFVKSIEQVATFADPGWHGKGCGASVIDSPPPRTIEKEEDPPLIYIRVPFADDNSSSKEYDSRKTLAAD